MSRITDMAKAIATTAATAAIAAIAAITAFPLSEEAPAPVPEPGRETASHMIQAAPPGDGSQEPRAEPKAQRNAETPRFTAGRDCKDEQYEGDRILPNTIGEVIAGNKQGTGFIIREDGLMATTRHGVTDHATAEVRLGSRTYTADVVLVHGEKDVALLQIRHKGEEFQPIATGPKGWTPIQQVTVVGFPDGCYMEYRAKPISSMLPLLLLVDHPSQGGHSGSPIMDQYGIMTGIATVSNTERTGAEFHDTWFHDRLFSSWVRLAKVDW